MINSPQKKFNNIKGVIIELNDGETFCSITIEVGNTNHRMVNLILKKDQFDQLCKDNSIGNKIDISFYITSKKKFDKWYTMANVIKWETNERADKEQPASDN